MVTFCDSFVLELAARDVDFPMLTTLPDTFPEALRLMRKRARLTQDEMGRAVGYSREQIARLESGSR